MNPEAQTSFILPTLASWSVHDPAIKTDSTSQALLTSEGWWITDPVPTSEAILQSLSSKGKILGILLTNENHERTASDLAEKINCPIHAPEKSLGLMDLNPNFFFRDGEILKGNLQVLEIPGASKSETCFYDPKHQILLMGDTLINLKETGFTFLPDKYCEDAVVAKKSLRRLLDLEFEIMTFAHGTPLLQAKEKLRELLNSCSGGL